MTLGVAGVFVLGMTMQWPFAFLAAVLATLILQAPAAPTARAGVTLLFLVALLMIGAFGLFSALSPYPGCFLIAQVLAVVWGFSLSVSGRSPILVTLVLMSAMLMPQMVKVSLSLAWLLATWMPVNLALALLSAWISFALVPPDESPRPHGAQAKDAGQLFDPDRRLLRMCLVTLPFLAIFHFLDSGAVLTLVFVALLCQQLAASTGAGPMVAGQTLGANLAGGLAAWVSYELVVIDAQLGFMAVISLLLCLFFGQWFVSDRPDAPLAASALTTALILFGGAMAPFGSDVDAKMLTRIFQVAGALAWVLAAFVIVDRILPEQLPDRRGDVT